MKILLLTLSLISFSSFSSVSSGEKISSIAYNNSTFTIGDIKHSVLTLEEFTVLHGSCWVKLGETVSIASSDLAVATAGRDGLSLGNENDQGADPIVNIPNLEGRVLRMAGNGSNTLGETQEDAFQWFAFNSGNRANSPDSTGLQGSLAEGFGSARTGASNGLSPRITDGRNNQLLVAHELNGTPRRASETRMKNFTVNMY